MFQHVINPSLDATNQSLTGCVYQVVQASGLQGNNVLQLIPVSKSDNLIPYTYTPVISNSSPVVLQNQTSYSVLPTASSTVLPSTGQVLTHPNFGNYIITTPGNTKDGAKSISVVDSKTSPLQNTTVILEKSHVNVPLSPNSPPRPTFMMINSKSLPGSIKTMPMLPSGHHLQIPANAEVKTVPASSLPFAVQQKILAATPNSGKQEKPNPSVIYVSPVNTVKTMASKNLEQAYLKHDTSNRGAQVLPSPGTQPFNELPVGDKMASPKMPMKWIVQENKESPACLVPVKSSNDTASKLLKILSETKNETSIANFLPVCNNTVNTRVIPIKDNALVMYNNKIYLLAKKGSDVFNTEPKNAEPTTSVPCEKNVLHSETHKHAESIKDISNKVVEVVLSKNKITKSNNPQISANVDNLQKIVNITVKKENTMLPQPFKLQVAKIEDNSICVSNTVNKKQAAACSLTNHASGANLSNTFNFNVSNSEPNTVASISLGPNILSSKAETNTRMSPKLKVNNKLPLDQMIKRLRWKFGLVKKEKVTLKRLPLFHTERIKSCTSVSNRLQNNVTATNKSSQKYELLSQVPFEMQQMKRKSISLDTYENAKRRKNDTYSAVNSGSPSVVSSNASAKTINCSTPPSITILTGPSSSAMASSYLPHTHIAYPPVVATSSYVDSWEENPDDLPPSSENNSYSTDIQNGQVSSVPLVPPTIRSGPVTPSPVDIDETVRDEKIRRLKELLREREQELEAIRWQRKP
ncbi:ligand-dependent nuclear receptor-interacting factor 1 [Bombina bombina]|uniref:ligand-dependent nuclear receptor-interacting factor 1 n=1 Tax=Bombina bombina TaxID=8345 RepID=UPI00235AF421|nr:ligand-dependent nuclear receptor-interacting factor 1 [Bombina bombina]